MKKLTVVFAALALMLGFAGTASAQHHGNHGNGGYHNNHNNHGDYRGNGGYHGNGGYRGNGGIVIGGGGIDIIIGGHRGYPHGGWNNGGWNNGGWNNGGYYPAPTRIVYERVYDRYGRSYTVSHVARWDNYYRGYVWYDQNGNLRVN
jgi:hypothetical protein